MTKPILYSFRRCPYAMRARLAILASGSIVELREVSLANKPAAMLAASPKGTVPVMVLEDGRVLEESLDIMTYALGVHDPMNWLKGATAEAMARVQRFDRDFKHHLDRYKYPNRYQSDPFVHQNAGLDMLKDQEAILTQQGFLASDTFSFLDAALFPFVRQFAAVDADWFEGQSIPATLAWLQRLQASTLFQACMVTVPIWTEEDPVTLFGTNSALGLHG
jgi:glutathione S-transferase